MKEQRIREELTQVRELLADLFQSGLCNVPESLLERIRKENVYVRQYGMEWLAGRMQEFLEALENRRHAVIDDGGAELCERFCEIAAYVEEGIRQSSFDEAGIRIGRKEWEQED